jgi:hypothetical protein
VFALAAGVPVLILATVAGFYAWQVVAGYRAILAGPTVEAVVLGSGPCRGTHAWQCDGKTGRAVRLELKAAEGTRIAYAAAGGQPRLGERVLVRYDPERPERVLLLRKWERDRRVIWLLARVGLGIALGLAVLGAVLLRRAQARRRGRQLGSHRSST